MSKALELSSQCSRSSVPILQGAQLVHVLTELQPSASTAKRRLPLNFVLLLDHSGSMAGDKLHTMKQAVNRIIDQLNQNDILSIVTFETRTKILIPAMPVGEREMIKNRVDQIQDAGGTNLAPALRAALDQVSRHHTENYINRLVLLTDGEATDNLDDSREQSDRAASLGIPIIGMGFGKDWNEDFIIELAERSISAPRGSQLGLVEYIPTPQEAVQVFQRVFRSMQVVAQDVTMHIRMVQGIETRRVWQVVPSIKDLGSAIIQGRTIIVPIGELEKGGVAYLAELILPPRPAGLVRIAQTDVTYSLADGELQRQTVDLILRYDNDPTAVEQVDDHIMNIVEKVQAFKLQTQALDQADLGDINGATRKLRQAVTILLTQGEIELADHMQQEAEQLERSGKISSGGRKTIKLTSRKTIKLSEV